MEKSTKSIIGGVLVIVAFFGIRYGLGQYHKMQSTLDEDIVYAYYQKQINAMRTFDAEAQCKMMHPRFRGVDQSRSPEGEQTVVMDRRETCEGLREAMDTMKVVVKALEVEPDMKFTIESVDLSPDRRQATVKLRYSLEIGKEVSVAATGIDTLMRHKGDVYVINSQSKSVIR